MNSEFGPSKLSPGMPDPTATPAHPPHPNQPYYPAPPHAAPGYPPPPGGYSKAAQSGLSVGLIISVSVLALLLVAGIGLYFTGTLDSWFGKSPTVVTGPIAATTSANVGRSPDAIATAATVPIPSRTIPSNGFYFVGTWGPNCPGSRADTLTLNRDGTAFGPGGSGSWTIDNGSTVTITVNGQSRSAFWEVRSADMRQILVRPTDGRQPTLVQKC